MNGWTTGPDNYVKIYTPTQINEVGATQRHDGTWGSGYQRTAKLTISLPEELISFADEIARERKISRSKVFSSCLQELLTRHRTAQMAEGYKAIANEQKQLAVMASEIEHEVIPEWK